MGRGDWAEVANLESERKHTFIRISCNSRFRCGQGETSSHLKNLKIINYLHVGALPVAVYVCMQLLRWKITSREKTESHPSLGEKKKSWRGESLACRGTADFEAKCLVYLYYVF